VVRLQTEEVTKLKVHAPDFVRKTTKIFKKPAKTWWCFLELARKFFDENPVV